jgi:3',5'-cyclic AMP phosphodiesterase CpdA
MGNLKSIHVKKKDRYRMKNFIVILFFVPTFYSCQDTTIEPNNEQFSFDITADMRLYAGPEYHSSEYFLGVCEAINKVGKGEFMISPGDIDPPFYVKQTIDKVLGSDYFWYPVLGNHEVETEEDMEFLNNYLSSDIPNLVNEGPENANRTMYSFDFKNTHFVVINQYYDGVSTIALDGDISDAVYDWLKKDLTNNSNQFTLVFGHEPLISMPDYDNGRVRHIGDNLDKYPENSFRFQQLLREEQVTAYFCGHTHNFSYTKINDIWQIDAGHSRGKGDEGAKSTFLKVHVNENNLEIDVYRCQPNFVDYTLTHQFEIN